MEVSIYGFYSVYDFIERVLKNKKRKKSINS